MTTPLAPALVETQDPLPEASWFWRRVFTIAVTACVMWMIWGAIDRLGATAIMDPRRGIPALGQLCKWLILFNAMMVTYYMVAPSAEQIVKMIQTAAMLKQGVQFAARTTVQAPESSAEAVSTAGKPPAPPLPSATPKGIPDRPAPPMPRHEKPTAPTEVTSEATEIIE